MALTKVTSGMVNPDPTDASNLSSGDVPLAQLDNVDTSGIVANQDDIALLGFKVAANGSLARYNLVDQSIDAFEDASGVDASASTDEIRDSSNYYSGATVSAYTVSAITSTGAGTWTCPANTTEAEVLIVAGGGGGSATYYAGGGGAGGVVYDADYTVVAATVYDVTVGAAGTNGNATAGGDSVWNVNAEGSGITMTADGGGRGGGGGGSAAGGAGGSGGGTDNDSGAAGGSSTQTSPTGAVGYGNAGSAAQGDTGGAGGGAAAAASVGSGTTGGAGGAGKLFSNFVAYGTDSSNVASTGSNGGYFGGGGGGASYNYSSPGGAPGVGGGGKGGGSSPTNANPGLANTGGGGGGADTTGSGGAGGTGVVLIRHREEAYNDMTLVSNAQTAQSAPTKGDLVITYTNGAGTATINTDIKAYISRDGSAYTSAVTLVSQGTTGGHTILTANGVDISGITTGTSMRWKIETLNQAVGKQTRIQAVSLGWS
jgi:hypothetical protein